MSTKLVDVLLGNIGFFWPQTSTSVDVQEAAVERGFIEQAPDGTLLIKTLEEDAQSRFFGHGRTGPPTLGIVGQVEDGGILVLDVTSQGSSTRIGGSRASVNRYRAHTLLKGVRWDELRSIELKSVTVHFPGLPEWLGSEMTTVEPEFDEEGKHIAITVKARSTAPISLPLSDGKTLTLKTFWELGGPSDRRLLFAPLAVGCHGTDVARSSDLLTPIFALQDLFNTAFMGFMAGEGGRASADTATDTKEAELWSFEIMEVPRRASVPRSLTEVPLFSLATIGGVEALPPWIELARRHPRLTGPIVNGFRYGDPLANTYLLDICAAIEYWRGINKSSWGRSSAKYPIAVANSVGPEFERWLGVDIDEWSDALWNSYVSQKHLTPGNSGPQVDVSTLALSGWVLLLASALCEISTVDWTAEHLLASHRLWGIKQELQQMFNEEPSTNDG